MAAADAFETLRPLPGPLALQPWLCFEMLTIHFGPIRRLTVAPRSQLERAVLYLWLMNILHSKL